MVEGTRGRRVDPAGYRALDLRAHTLLSEVPLHDVWEVVLPGGGDGRTLADLRAVATMERMLGASALVRALFGLRGWLGRIFRLDIWPPERDGATDTSSFAARLTADDRARTRLATGTPDGPFRLLYEFENESVGEVRNATVHAFSVFALSRAAGGYTLYWAIHVAAVGAITPLYMALIDPFRRFVVYPAVTRAISQAWADAYGDEPPAGIR